jgi:hypothetical protein
MPSVQHVITAAKCSSGGLSPVSNITLEILDLHAVQTGVLHLTLNGQAANVKACGFPHERTADKDSRLRQGLRLALVDYLHSQAVGEELCKPVFEHAEFATSLQASFIQAVNSSTTEPSWNLTANVTFGIGLPPDTDNVASTSAAVKCLSAVTAMPITKASLSTALQKALPACPFSVSNSHLEGLHTVPLSCNDTSVDTKIKQWVTAAADSMLGEVALWETDLVRRSC